MTRTLAACLLACSAAIAPLAAAQTQPADDYTAPRTAFGHPSFEGAVWTQNFVMLMESTPQTPTLTLPEEEANAVAAAIGQGIGAALDRALDPEVRLLMADADGFPIVRGERRTRTVVIPEDGRIPYTELGRRLSNRGPVIPEPVDYETRPYWERCITSLGLPPVHGVGTTSVNPREFIQTPDHIVIHTEYGDEARIIPFTDTHRPPELHQRIGDSIARWEGETLVIETIGLPENERVRFFSNLVVPNGSKVIERFTRLSDDELLYQYTVENPEIYSAPWLAEYSLYRTDQRMFEHACHEGNYSLPNILKGGRINDARMAAERGR